MSKIERILSTEMYDTYDFGLSDLSNIKKAIKALDSSGINYEKDDMSSYKTMGIFYFMFKNQKDLDKAYGIVENVIDPSKESEWD